MFIYVDAALLAVPNYAVNEETAFELADRISHFAAIASSNVPILLVLADGAEDILWGAHCGPGYEEIQAFVELMNIGHLFSARDLSVVYSSILQRSTKASECCPIDVCTFNAFACDPCLPATLLPAALVPETERVILSVAASSVICPLWLVGSALDDRNLDRVNAYAMLESVAGISRNDYVLLPANFEGQASIFSNFSQLVSLKTASDIWRQSSSDQQLAMAITLFALEISRVHCGEISLDNLLRFTIGPGFFESLKMPGCWRRTIWPGGIGAVRANDSSPY